MTRKPLEILMHRDQCGWYFSVAGEGATEWRYATHDEALQAANREYQRRVDASSDTISKGE